MKKNIFLCLSLFLCLFVFQHCKRRTEPLPPVVINPCDTAKLPTANFKIYESVRTDFMEPPFDKMWENIDTDTLITSTAYFASNEWGAKYKWRLGGETINIKSFSRDNFPIGTFNVSLETTKKHPLWGQCFPTTDTVFTKNRTFKVVGGVPSSKVLGNYSGIFLHNPNQVKTLDISLFIHPIFGGIVVKGFDEACVLENGVDIIFVEFQPTYKQIYFFHRGTRADINATNACRSNTIGIIKVHGQNSDSLTMNYRVYDFSNPSNINMNPPMRTFK
ncbi:MAG: hypothetical protein EAZ20_02905 [Bacteroidetes bacterium]|nr:MAG: hypothetical protein EAZ20_02905 [Bacteroidota bacterium]